MSRRCRKILEWHWRFSLHSLFFEGTPQSGAARTVWA